LCNLRRRIGIFDTAYRAQHILQRQIGDRLSEGLAPAFEVSNVTLGEQPAELVEHS
jgi:hypothetical protein